MSAPERLGRYRIGERIGEGGMGVVYRAESDGAAGFAKTVAIKCIRPALARDERVRAALIDEARLAQRLEHGNIVQVLDLGADGDIPFVVVEYVDGVPLKELLDGPRLDIADALYIVEQVAAALDYAHGLTDQSGRPAGVVHRDVNPRNILVSREGVVKLADFGIAKALHGPSHTIPGTIKGSLGYLSPEQAIGGAQDARTDQFALGVVLYELVSGKNPLDAAGDVAEYRALLDAGIPPLPGDEALAAIVARACAGQPADRYERIADFRGELEAWRVARGIRTTPDGTRAAVRDLLGGALTHKTRALELELASLPARHTAARPAAAPPRRWLLPAIAITVLALIGIAVYAVVRAPASSEAPAPDAAPALPPPLPAPAPSPPSPPPDATPMPDAAVPRTPAPRRTGRLKINLLPYAEVSLGGARLGRTPIDTSVRAGRHELVLSNPETGQRTRRSITVPVGGTLEIRSWQ